MARMPPKLPARQVAAHVRDAVAHTLQAKMPGSQESDSPLAAHVRAAVAFPHAKSTAVQPKSPIGATGSSSRVLQKADRPRRSSTNYDTDFKALNAGKMEATASGKLSSFISKAKATIAIWKARAPLQPERNTAKPPGVRSEKTSAYLRARMNGMEIASGESGGNQHGEMRILDGIGWDSRSQGNQYYFVCDDGKECCYLCTAIAGLLGIAVAATDNSLYPEYVTPVCLQTDDSLWQRFVGDEAHALWLELGEEQREKLRKNLGWVCQLSLAF